MTRISKQGRRRAQSPRKRGRKVALKTGSLKDNLPNGYKPHDNAYSGELQVFIPKIR